MPLTTPDWIAPGKLRWVWALWEPIELYARGGYGAGVGDGWATGHWVRGWYERMHSPEILDQLAEAGVNLVTTHFYKGFGLQAENAEMERAAAFTRLAHQRGIRVLGYHQFSTVIYETMKDEVPELENWIQRNPDGSCGTYGSTYWRWKACPSHDGFITYLKRVMTRCLTQADMDGVEFDGTAYDCYCENCQRLFREYLGARHPEPLERFGLPHFKHVRLPTTWMPKDPVWQEWVRFRTHLMEERLKELRLHVHETKPGAALVTYEDSPALFRRQRTRLLPERGDYLDLALAESHDVPTVLEGQLITKVRHLQEGTAMGRVTLSTAWLRETSGIVLPREPRTVELDMAECLACGGQVVTANWALRAGAKRDGSAFFEQPQFHQALRLYMQFARDHEFLYNQSQPAANVWVYHSLNSLSFDHGHAYNSILGWEQALLGRVAFRQAKSWHLAELAPRDVLIVSDQQCLSDEECGEIAAALDRGCHVVATGMSGDCDENFRQRLASPLLTWRDRPNLHFWPDCPGRTAHPEAAMGKTMAPELPAAAEEMRKLPNAQGLAAALQTPLDTLAYVDIYRVPPGHVVHVVHYGDKWPQYLNLLVGSWLNARQATLHSPYLKEPQALALTDNQVHLPPEMGCYGAVLLEP